MYEAFYVRRRMYVLGAVIVVLGSVSLWMQSGWVWAMTALSVLITLIAIELERRHPLVVVTSWCLRFGSPLRPREVPHAAVAKWCTSDHWLEVQTVDEKRSRVALSKLAPKDRERLVALLRSLGLEEATEASCTERLARLERRMRAVLVGALLLPIFVVGWVFYTNGFFFEDEAPIASAPYVHPQSEGLPPETRDCLQRPESEAYLRQVHAMVMERWELPEGAEAGQTAVLSYRLQASGELAEAAILSEPVTPFAESALEALEASSPFPPMHGHAACLAELRHQATFTNPELGS